MAGSDASVAPGSPGIAPTWSSSDKDAIGASHLSSRVWFTVGHGILNEVYWPHVDEPRIRDLGFIVADGAGFWSEVKRDAAREVRQADPGVPAITAIHRHARYELTLRICADDHADTIRLEARLRDLDDGAATNAHPLRLYPLIAPRIRAGNEDGQAWIGSHDGHPMLFASGGSSVLALASAPAASRQSVGYVGTSDGWTDFSTHGRMTWTYQKAPGGNVAGLSEVTCDRTVQLVLSFGSGADAAGLQAMAALAIPFEHAWSEYTARWAGFHQSLVPPPTHLAPRDRDLYHTSAAALRSMRDRTNTGATVASLSVPWGNSRDDRGGYHLVWARDLGECAGALVGIGAVAEARRTLAYLIASQDPDGHWPQNQWVDGRPYWTGRQLDEAAYPVLLVGALRAGAAGMHGDDGARADACRELLDESAVDRLVHLAAGYMARSGPSTEQDRWEETAGLTPSTLAPVVAALVECAEHLPERAARYCLELADDWNASIEEWIYVRGSRLAGEHGVDGTYARITSADVLRGAPLSTPVALQNRHPAGLTVPADEMVGTDFLALVRCGLRMPDDPRILSSLVVADALLRTETPSGPIWHRYNGDGYGEHEDGSPYDGTGIGRGWPLLVGERGHYELAAGRDAQPYLGFMRAMGSSGGMLPEQVWDAEPIPERGLAPGRPSGSAMPLAWAHAEYLKLVRSIAQGRVIDRPDAAWQRYRGTPPAATRATWRFTAQRPEMIAGRRLRLESMAPARVRYSVDGWTAWRDIDADDTGLGVWVTDLPGTESLVPGQAIDFTCWWPEAGRWEGRDMRVRVIGGIPAARG